MDVKEKLSKEHDKKQHRETSDGAFRARHGQGRGRTMRQQRTTNEDYRKTKQFRGRCHRCNKVSHKKYEWKIKHATDENEIAFTVLIVVNKVGCWTAEPRHI